MFFAFRVMVGIGMVMIAAGLAGAWLWWRGRVFTSRGYLYVAGLLWPLGFIAILAGWTVTETGRQPWLVNGLLRTADAVSPVAFGAVATSFALIVVTYLGRVLDRGPLRAQADPQRTGAGNDVACRGCRESPALRRAAGGARCAQRRAGDLANTNGAHMLGLDFSLPVVWAAIIGVATALYVVLDGFDLGVGILFPLFPEERDRDQMMNSVAPFWDGNETWLVLGGGGLWVAFPKAFAVIMPAVYLPVIVLLLALIFRGVAFEFRWVAKPHHGKWDIAFAVGSLVAAFAQGCVLGGILQGSR